MESNEGEKLNAELAARKNKNVVLDRKLKAVDKALKVSTEELFEAKVKWIAAGEICDVRFEDLMMHTGIVKSFYGPTADKDHDKNWQVLEAGVRLPGAGLD